MATQTKRLPLASIEEVSEYLGLSKSTLHDQRRRRVGFGVLAFKVGNHLKWDWAEVDALLAEQRAS